MHTELDTLDKKYMFIVDNVDLALSIIDAGFNVVALQNDSEGYFSLDGLMEYLSSIEFRGTCRMDYMFVPACSTKNANDALAEFFRAEMLNFREGWKLFKDKDYLQKLSYRTEIQKLLHGFIDRYEKPPETEPDLDRFHILDKNGNPSSPFDIAIVEEILETVPFFVLQEIPFVYEHGVYLEDRKGCRLKRIIQKHLYRKLIHASTLGSIYALLVIQPEVQKSFYDLYNMPAHWINFRNGYYDPIERVMIDHDPKYLSLNQVPHEFHPEKKASALAGGEVIRAYLDTSLPDPREQQLFWEYAGYCMTIDTQMQKFLMLTGNGGTGKSVLIDLVQKLVGMENCSNIPIQDLNRRFYATGMFGKLLNACGDIPCQAMSSTDVIKKSVGEDAIVFEKKGKDATHFFSQAKLLFSANGMPENLDDKSEAYYRRLMILELDHVISAEKKDTKLKEKVGKEMTFAVHMAMEALSTLYVRGFFDESDRSKELVKKLRRASDSVQAFLDEMICSKEGSRIARSQMFRMYDDYCSDNGRQPLGKMKNKSAEGNGEATVERLKDALHQYQYLYEEYGADPLDTFYEDVEKKLTDVMKSDQELRDPAMIREAQKIWGKVETPFVISFGYTRDAFDYIEFAILILAILSAALAAPVFSERYRSGEDSVLRCTLYGRGKLVRITVLAELTVVSVMYFAGIGMHLLLSDMIFGFETLKESVQTLYTVYSLPGMNLLDLQIVLALAGWLCCMAVTAMSLCISARVTEPSTSMVLALILVILPMLLYSIGGGASWTIALLPSASAGLSNNMLMSLVDLRFLKLGDRVFWYPVVLVCTAAVEFFLFAVITHFVYSRHQVAK